MAPLAEPYAHDVWNLLWVCAIHLHKTPIHLFVTYTETFCYCIPVSVTWCYTVRDMLLNTLPEIILLIFPTPVLSELQRTLSASIEFLQIVFRNYVIIYVYKGQEYCLLREAELEYQENG